MPKNFNLVRKALARKISFSLIRLRRRLEPILGRRQAFGHFLAWSAFALLAGVVLLAIYALILLPFTPGIDDIRKARIEQYSVLLTADGKELATYRRLNREWVPLNKIAKPVIDALIATEDRRFYEHKGIDFRRTVAAAGLTLVGKRQGGSTITQQLARNLFVEEIGRAPNMTRKIKEAITAVKLEYAYSKPQILETYLNTVPFLYNADGIEMAARTYFDTSASRLTVTEAATLVGMLKGTAYYNPVLNPDRALERRNLVMALMVQNGSLHQDQYETLRKRPLGLDFERQKPDLGPAPHFAEQVRRWLMEWAEKEGYDIYADGLVIHSTIDSRLQRLANRVVERDMESLQAVAEVEWGTRSERLLSTSLAAYGPARRRVEPFVHFWRANPELTDAFVKESPEFTKLRNNGSTEDEALGRLLADGEFMNTLREKKTRLEAGFIALDPRNGAIRAWVGSRDFTRDRYDHVGQARRQPGSTFKPFVYAAALQEGISRYSEFVDDVVSIRLEDGKVWSPGDAGGVTGEVMTMEDGLVYSKNTITAQVMEKVGPKRVARLAQQAGVRDSTLDVVPSLALGTSPVTLLEMVGAYGTFAGLGERTAPIMVSRITDRKGNVLAEFLPEREQVLDRDTTVKLIDMLRGAVDRGTGRGVRQIFGIYADVAGKTGTTQNNTDGWFILMHPQLVAGAWIGFNDPRVRMRSNYWGQGGHNALYLVGDFFQQALASRIIDPGSRFPLAERPGTLEATIEVAEKWVREMLGLEREKPPPRRRLPPVENRRPDDE